MRHLGRVFNVKNARFQMLDICQVTYARAISRKEALKYVSKPALSKRPVFVVSWDPRLPSIDDIQNKYAIHAYTHGPVTGSGSLLSGVKPLK